MQTPPRSTLTAYRLEYYINFKKPIIKDKKMELPTIDYSFLENLPGDPNKENQPRQVQGALYSEVKPTPVSRPKIVASVDEVADLLGLNHDEFKKTATAEIFAGNKVSSDLSPYAVNYGGHQFGQWAGQLGDGRAITLCEIIGKNNDRWEVQLKGAGRTPYSRTGDGRAVLRSSIREFLCSEAMHHLNIPTTRALTLVDTGEEIVRDMFYDGNPQEERGAIVCRVAPSFIRFGNFELPSYRGDIHLTKKLLDYTIKYHFSHLTNNKTTENTLYENWFFEVCEKTAFLVSEWERVGFVHGVLNTDNMSILGLTIDYGPYGWIDNFDRNWTPNTTDAQYGRYRFGNQPNIAHWNLYQLARAIASLFSSDEPLHAGLQHYKDQYEENRKRVVAAKLGLYRHEKADYDLMEELLCLLEKAEADMTIFFRLLQDIDMNFPSADHFESAFYNEVKKKEFFQSFNRWLGKYVIRVKADKLDSDSRYQIMCSNNPKYILRNYLAQQAIDQANNGDFSQVENLLDVMRNPYDDQPENSHLFALRPEWAKSKPGCSMLSCSS